MDSGGKTEAQPPARPGKGRGRRCIVHIGLNKTGTTTIQGWLAQNAAALEAQGIRYLSFDNHPDTRLNHALGVAAMAARLSGRTRPAQRTFATLGVDDPAEQDRQLDAFTAALDESMAARGCRTYVLSSEFLPSWLPQAGDVQRLHEWLSARFARVFYVVYLRDQIDWVPSAYGQHIKVGGTIGLDDFIAERGERDYFGICRTWIKGTAPRRLDVRLLDREFLAAGDLVADFGGLIGADLSQTEAPRTLNEALDAGTVNALLDLNRSIARAPDDWTPEKRADRVAELMAARGHDKLRLSPDQALDVARRNAGSNDRLRRRFFRDRPVLFPRSHRVLAEAGEAAFRDTDT